MKYISVFSGIEAATVAWRPLGWEAIAFSEIEPFPCQVLKHHYPDVPNLGDISKVDWRQFLGTVDLVVGGSPCQSFSVAGSRTGLDGASGLVREYFRLLSECKPRWFLWENVPGVVSSNGGLDWIFILREWHKLGYNVSFRVLDAQYAGVPQRRRRIFAVGYLGDWRPPAKVLFESYSLQRHPAPGRKAGKENSRGIESCAYTAGSFAGYKRGVGTLKANGGDLGGSSETLIAKCLTSSNQRLDWETETLVLNDQGGRRIDISKSVAGTLRSQSKGHEPIVFEPGIMSRDGGHVYEGTAPTLRAKPGDNQPAVFCIAGNTIDRQIQNGGNGAGFQPEISYTLNTIDRHAVMCAPVAPTIGASGPPYSRPGNERVETEALVVESSVTPPITTKWAREGWTAYDETAPLMFKIRQGCERVETEASVFRETADCLTAAYGTKWNGNASAENGSLFAMNSLVRRITPLECERLQGFPDGYTDIEFKGKPAPDGARYKALGNSMAVPCMAWIGKRIQAVEDGTI